MQNHVVRRVDAQTRISPSQARASLDSAAMAVRPRAQLRQPHSIAFDPGPLLICDIGNHRIRRVELTTRTIETYGGTGERG